MPGWTHGLEAAFGLHAEPKDFTLLQVVLRAAATYLLGLVILRASRNRFLARESGFDVLLVFMLGSVLSRAINGTSPFLLSLAASALLVGIHQLLAWASFRSARFERLVDGTPASVVRRGEVVRETSRHHLLSEANIRAALRLKAHMDDPDEIESARVESNGEVSFVLRKHPPRIVEVKVEEGVQVVRLEIS